MAFIQKIQMRALENGPKEIRNKCLQILTSKIKSTDFEKNHSRFFTIKIIFSNRDIL